MSTFEVKVVKLSAIESICDCDNIELAVVGDYRSVVRKNQFKAGDLAVYIPESSICPNWLLEKLGLVGKLAGPNKNRVKAAKFRGCLSQGLVYPVIHTNYIANAIPSGMSHEGDWYYVTNEKNECVFVTEGMDVAEVLGIEKYSPPIPAHMAGEVFNAHGYTLSYDIENIKKFPDVLKDDEMVLVTEKLHGTWTCFGYHPDIPHPIITSKGLSGQGLAFKLNEANATNLYILSLVNSTDAEGNDALARLQKEFVSNIPLYILGETYGKGVQDLTYGLTKPHFRAFDIYIGAPGQGRYLSGHEFTSVCRKAGIETVPVLYHGPFSKQAVAELTDGKDNISGSNIREGVVIRPLLEERRDDTLGRVILKSVSAAYLLRKGDATEYT